MTQISLSDVSVKFAGTALFHSVTFTVAKGERWGVVGRNGSGKTTLFNLIVGTARPTTGDVTRLVGLRVSMMDQHGVYEAAATVWDAAAGSFAQLRALELSLEKQATHLGELGERSTSDMLARYDQDLERFEREGGYTFAPRVDAVLHGLGFDPDQARDQPLSTLSGGERGRIGLARQLVAPADVLLLDEPTNHLDLDTTQWLERYLRDVRQTLLIISHDRSFLESIADHTLHFEDNRATPYGCGYAAFVRQREEQRLARHRAYTKQARIVAAEEDYVRRNIAGVNSRQAKGRRKRLERTTRLSPPPDAEGTMALRLEVAERGGDQVVVAEGVTIAIPRDTDTTPRILLENFTARITRGEVIGVVGPNGAGKSTLLKALLGEWPLVAGELRLGGSIRPAYYTQNLTHVPTNRTTYDVILDLRPRWTRGQIQGHLGRFGFSADDVRRKVESLSGGERARVALAMIMLAGANFLVFDEPTNHLDVESIEALEDAIDAFEGTVLIVSHDRSLLRSLVTRVWLLHAKRITDFGGNFAQWEEASAERLSSTVLAAKEDEAVRRVHERQKTRRSEQAERSILTPSVLDRLNASERRVNELEGRAAELRTRLEDPALYATQHGVSEAHRLAHEADVVRRELGAAIEAWVLATEAAETARQARYVAPAPGPR
ncbi:MAG: ABC-F family ATP-binding cassette domain-containing protein [Gemmatimonadaceae bacterium]